jgi:hypothetical protein
VKTRDVRRALRFAARRASAAVRWLAGNRSSRGAENHGEPGTQGP